MKSETHKLMERFINHLTDEPYPDILYHFTSGENAYSILTLNAIYGVVSEQVSFTSDESYGGNGFQPMYKTNTVFVLDAQLLAKDYDLERFVYQADKDAKFDDYVNEYEWVVSGEVINIDKYLLYIGDNGIPKEYLDKIKEEFPNISIQKWY